MAHAFKLDRSPWLDSTHRQALVAATRIGTFRISTYAVGNEWRVVAAMTDDPDYYGSEACATEADAIALHGSYVTYAMLYQAA